MPRRASAPDGLSLSRPVTFVNLLLNNKRYFWHLATLVIIGDIVLTQIVTRFVACTQRPFLGFRKSLIADLVDTEIDFTTYMRQIDVYMAGELDYSQLKGPSGPLVYALGCHHACHVSLTT
jgi:alpha-1,3-mannosyltransferase